MRCSKCVCRGSSWKAARSALRARACSGSRTASYGNKTRIFSRHGFDVVVHRSKGARLQFRNLVNKFRCPDQIDRWSMSVRRQWHESKAAIRDEKTIMLEKHVLPVLAMNKATPCAAALYSNASMNKVNAFFVVSEIVGNAGEHCKDHRIKALYY